MKKTINFYDFERAFVSDTYKNQFTYEGKKALFEYLEEYEDSTGDQIELDVVALCCDYTEYDSLEDFQADYGQDEYPDVEAIQDSTHLIMINENAFIIQQF